MQNICLILEILSVCGGSAGEAIRNQTVDGMAKSA